MKKGRKRGEETNEQPITYGELEIRTPYEIQMIKEVEITGKLNDHGKLKLKGIVKEEAKGNKTLLHFNISGSIHDAHHISQ